MPYPFSLVGRTRRRLGPARLSSTLLVLGAAVLQSRPAIAQLFQWTPEQLIKYTAKNPYERFPDGRPKVPDELIERLKVLVAEEVQAVLPARGISQPVRAARGLEGPAAGPEDGRARLHHPVHAGARRHHRGG